MAVAKLKILIVDDEPLARNRLVALSKRIACVDQTFIAGGGNDAVRQLESSRIDALLLDIDMPDLGGIAVANHCRTMDHAPDIIFTTAHSAYAVDAFRFDAADYLLKPVKEALLREAFAKVSRRTERHSSKIENMSYRRLWVKDGHSCVQIRIIDIERIEAERDYMRLCLVDRHYLIHGSMQALENKLPTGLFVRVHRSTMIRRDLVSEIRRKGRRYFAILTDDREISIGPNFIDGLAHAIADHDGGLGRSETVTE